MNFLASLPHIKRLLLFGFLLLLPLIFNPLTGDIEQIKVMALFVLSLTLWISQDSFKTKQKHLVVALLVLTASICISTLLAQDIWLSLMGSEHRFFGALAWLAALSLAFSTSSILKESHHGLLRVLAMSGTATAIVALVSNITMYERLMGTLGNPNVLGKFMLFTIIISIGLYIMEKKPTWLIFSLPQLAALIATGNRASIASLFIILIASSFFIFKTNKKRIFAGAFSLTALSAIAIPAWSRITNMETVSTRLEIYKASFQAIIEKPFFGYGFDHASYALDLPNFTLDADRAHQLLLDAALNLGLFGAIILAFISLYTLTLLIKSTRKTYKIYGLALLGLLLSTQVSFFTTIHLVLFFLGVGLALTEESALEFRRK